ncbi:hypothetical protein QVD17_25703 [Tagetes erecta]|uniref:Uncharacterized protein n=1 Tax=Tagetes erecta TaxID=13708 RepID=A0AAD8NVL6_TARER|nr:hypothetical protein QVD17_25703 [Tagetes erecta]
MLCIYHYIINNQIHQNHVYCYIVLLSCHGRSNFKDFLKPKFQVIRTRFHHGRPAYNFGHLHYLFKLKL